MKRTNLVLDEHLLIEATRLLGEKTYSATVNRALRDAIQLHRMKGITHFFGTDVWEGDLSKMRKDTLLRPLKSAKKTNKKRSLLIDPY